MTFEFFVTRWLRGALRAVGLPFLSLKRREELEQWRKAANSTEKLVLDKMEAFLDTMSFRFVPHGPVQADLDAFLREFCPGWNVAHFDGKYESLETVYPEDPVAHMLLPEPLCEESLEFLARAEPEQVRSLFFAVAPSSTQMWVPLLEIMEGWNSLESIGFSHFFFGPDADLEFVRFLVNRLTFKRLVLHGAVVRAVGPDFFKDTRAREFVFPSTVRYESTTWSYPLLDGCSSEEVRGFFQNLPAQKVVLGGQDFDFDGLLCISDNPLVDVVDALQCKEVALNGVKAVGSVLELVRVLFSGKFTSIGLFGEHLSPSHRVALWQLVAANPTLRRFEVDSLDVFSRTVVHASPSLRSLAFSKLGCDDPAYLEDDPGFYELDLLQSEVVSAECRSFDPDTMALCASVKKQSENAQRRALCLLFCCLQLAPNAHKHIVPSVGAVPVPVMQYAVEHAAELVVTKEEEEEKRGVADTSRSDKRKLDSAATGKKSREKKPARE